MSTILSIDFLAWSAPIALLVGTVLAGLLAFHPSQRVRQLAHWPSVVGITLALGASGMVAHQIWHIPERIHVLHGYNFLSIGGLLEVRLALYIDSLTAVMLLLVNSISFLVAIYSIGYMRQDEGYARYFAIISLFVFSMNMLVLTDNYLVLYIFWEGVGLCSYLLIGHWYEKPSASQAARKAFLVNRIGDMLLFLGIVYLWYALGTLRFGAVFWMAERLSREQITVIGLLLMGGACAKSAQFPLHTWLPDAMEGPTPVSALIHAATMVTAGVYLLARSSLILILSPAAQLIVLTVGMITALLGACVAATQFDLKRVLAYSTISQLGLMFTSLGSAAFSSQLMPLAAGAAILHLVMHGIFKALLFLAAGNIMHSTGGIIDMRLLGGLRRQLPYTHLSFIAGALALAAIPPFAGFYSKDAILAVLVAAGQEQNAHLAWWYLGGFFLTGALTAFYIGRAYFLTFWTRERFSEEVGAHLHESSGVMLVPVIILALASTVAGLILARQDLFQVYIQFSRPFGELVREAQHGAIGMWAGVSVLLALAGMGLAFWRYQLGSQLTEPVPSAIGPLYALSAAKFFVDEIYSLIVVKPVEMIAILAGWVDKILDGAVDLVGWTAWSLSRVFRPMQNGQVQFYALAILLGLAVFALVLISRGGL